MANITENQRKALEDANEWTVKNIQSWKDLFRMAHERMHVYQERNDRAAADMALATMYAMIVALEELPEEGDAVNIALRMNTLLITEPEKLGMRVTLVSAEDVQKAGEVLRALGVMVSTSGETLTAPEVSDEEAPATDKKHLH